MVPMNLMKNKVADYIITGQWAKKAYKEAQKYGKANAIASSEDKTFSYIPDCSDLPVSEDADYVYICENNTIYGTKFKTLPNTKGKTLDAWYGIPCTLESNVERLHKEVFDNQEYIVPDEIKTISNSIETKTGYHEGDGE